MNVLITAGATREYIDGVRFISNISTGSTGAMIAEILAQDYINVTLLYGENAITPESTKIRKEVFYDFESLNNLVKTYLESNEYDFIIHSAAVSDYSIDKVNGESVSTQNKLDSSVDMSLTFKKNPKIIQNLKSYSKNKKIKVIGFKLTNKASEEQRLEKITNVFNSGADFVVHNDLSEISETKHKAKIFSKNMDFIACDHKNDIAFNLKNIITKEES